MNTEGDVLAVWTHGGNQRFAEISDVHFVSEEGHHPNSSGYWLILDKGNHRIVALKPDGSFIHQIGRELGPKFARRWAVPGLFLESDLLTSGTLRCFPPLDFLYYPDRILGNGATALFVWEPLSGTLVQLYWGNLLPLTIPTAHRIEWIGADQEGLVGWSDKAARMSFYGSDGKLKHECDVDGRPVFSNLPRHEFWLQDEDRIQRWTWLPPGTPDKATRPLSENFGLLLSTAHYEMERFSESEAKEALSRTNGVLDDVLALADELLLFEKTGGHDPGVLDRLSERFSRVMRDHRAAEISLHETLHHWCLGILELLLASPAEPCNELTEACEVWRTLIGPTRSRWNALQKRIDDVYIMRLNLAKRLSGDDGLDRRLHSVAEKWESDITEIGRWIYRWSGRIDGSVEILPLPQTIPSPTSCEEEVLCTGSAIQRPAVRRFSDTSSCFREVDRILLRDSSDDPPTRPHSLIRSRDGRFFVSLFGSHRVLILDQQGNPISSLGKPGAQAGELRGPAGLAIDDSNRLWVADYSNHRIQIFESGTARVIGSRGSEEGRFICPVGIAIQSDGSALVADKGNHRIVKITSSGKCEIFCDRIGGGASEICYPTTFCTHPKDGMIWLVDSRNHRILRICPDGSLEPVLQERGLDTGQLFRPGFVAVFRDDAIVVAHNQWENNLKLFSPNGEEFGKLILDYEPGGLLVAEDHLLVPDFSGDSVRVYRRS
jgi:hypothetical protein